MNEEIILDKLRKMLFTTQQANECGLSNNDFKEDIQILSGAIGLIENLIQRNKELEQIEKEHKEENGRLRDKIKELEEIDLTTVYMDGIYDERNKWIINIKEKIKKYNKQRETTDDKEIYYRLVDYIDILQELLEESEK